LYFSQRSIAQARVFRSPFVRNFGFFNTAKNPRAELNLVPFGLGWLGTSLRDLLVISVRGVVFDFLPAVLGGEEGDEVAEVAGWERGGHGRHR
jgi:hypothetical protein